MLKISEMMKHTNVEIIVDNKIEHTFSHVRNQFIAVLCGKIFINLNNLKKEKKWNKRLVTCQ